MAPAQPAAALSAGVDFSADDLPTWQTNGTVWGIDAAKGKVVAGGTFSQVRPPDGQSGSARSQNALVILDGETGAPDQCQFSMSLSGGTPTVRAVQTSPDGNVVYIGGNFSNVGGVTVARIAALDIVSCTVLPFRAPLPSSTVTALAIHDNTLYAGGLFRSVGSASRLGFAAFNATTGALLDWRADAVRTRTNLPVEVAHARAVQVSPDGSKVVVGGDMFEINGVYSHSIAMVTAASGPNGAGGEVLRTYPSGFFPDTSVTKTIVNGDDGRFYIGNEGTGGGVFDGKAAFSWDTGDQIWRDTCLGAVQDLLVRGETIYSASHHHDCASINAFPDGIRRYFNAQSTQTMEFLGWLPLGNDGIGEGIGPRGLTVVTGRTTGKEYLWSGGEFTRINGQGQQGLTRFGPDDTGAPPIPVISAEATSDGTIQVRFRSVVDSDDDHLTYSVFRSGTTGPIWQGTAKALWWEREQVTFVDENVTPGTNYTYRVTASDGPNTSGQSAPSSARALAPTEDYGSVLRSLNADASWSGTAVGSWVVDSAAGSSRTNATHGLLTDGAVAVSGDSAVPQNSTAFSFDGSNDHIRTEVLQPGPSTYTISAWIKTTTTRGGKIIGFGDGRPRTGTNDTRLSSSYDRHLYMANNGRVIFGAYPGSAVTISSPSALNDGEWHYLVGAQGANGMALYVDGVPVASNAVTGAQNYWGVWHVGGDRLGSWPSAPSSQFFAGLIDEVGIYPSALGKFDVAHLYSASGRSLDLNPIPSDQYGAAVFDGQPELYWRFDESGSSAQDSSPFGLHEGGYGSNADHTSGVLPDNSAVRTTGSNSSTVSTSQALSPSAAFTAETWFKTTSTDGGKIFGFESSRTGTSSSYDKQLYMTDDGRLIWGSWIGEAAIVTSADSYNDGVWHHAAAVIDSTGRKLFIDGEQVAQSAVTGAETADGYWRVGGGNLSGWPQRPSNDYFDGTIDEFAVYSRSLPLSTVAAHYALGVAGAAAPGVATDLQATAADGDVTLTWSEADSGFGVQEYRIYRSSDAAFEISDETLVGTSEEPSFTDVAVTPGVVYYRLVAVGPGDNAGAATDAVEFTVPDTTAPDVPADLVAVVDQSTVSLSWTAPADDVAVAGYQVHRGDVPAFTPSAETLIGTVTEATFADADRPASTVYYRVIAVDAAGNASEATSAVVAIVPDVTAPTTPTDLTATTGGDPEIALTWTASDDDLGVTGYDVYRGTTAGFTVDADAKIASVSETSYVDTALTPGTWYYRVVAVDAAGNNSPASAVASDSVADVTAPTVPTGLAASADGNDVELTWTAASDDVAVDHYEVHRGSASDFTASPATKLADSATASYTDPNRPAGTDYYRVIAVDAAGNASDVSEIASVQVPDVTPPSTVTVTALLTDGSVNLSWGAATDDVAVTGYQVHRGQSADFAISAATKIADTTTTSYVDDTATAGSWYYRVVAVDAAGNTAAASAAAAAAIPDTTAPSAPAALAAAASGENVQLSWTASTDDVGVVGYEIHRSGTAGFTPAEATRIGASAEASFADLAVAPGAWYYRVIAVDAAGNASAASAQAEVEVLELDVTPPSAPADLAATVDGADVGLTWSAASDNVAVTGYQVHRGATADFAPDAGSLLATVTETEYSDADRAAGTWYYRVVAVDAEGNTSAASASAEVVVADASGPTAATDVAATVTGTDVSVSWTAATDDVGVAGYRVYRGATADFEVSAELMVAETTGLAAAEESVPAGTWFYRVVAFDDAGNMGAPSAAAEVTIADTTAPTVVTGVTALPGESGVAVGWEQASDDVAVTAYRVFRGTTADFTAAAANQVAEVATESYLDAAPTGTWFYKVMAVDAAGNASAASAAAEATVADAAAPSVPAGVNASADGPDVTVSWSASSDDVGVVGYQLHRGSSAGFTVSAASKIADVTATSFTDAGRPVGTWYYRVVAVDAAGNASAASTVASATVAGTTVPVTITVPVTADAMVFGVLPGSNYGSNTQLSSRGGTSPIESLLQVDLPDAPAGTTLTDAELRLRTSTDPTATSTDSHVVHLISGAWTESGVTWTNRPTAEGSMLGALGAAPATNTAYSASLSAQALSGALGSEQTLRLSSSGADNLRLWSSEAPASSYRPVLVLTFTPGSGPAEDTSAPSVPTGVGATVAGTSVVVSWSASSDDVGVVGYQLHRGSTAGFAVSAASKVADVSATSFTDAARTVGTWFYRVVAVDAAGNASAASAEVAGTVVGSGEPVTVSVPIQADAMVLGVLPTSNQGANNQLSSRGGGSSPIESFLSVELPDAPAGMMLTAAELQVRTSTDPTSASADSHSVRLMSGTWTESTVTWNNRPTAQGAVLGSLGATSQTNTAYTSGLSANVLAGVLGTTQTLRISSTGTDNLRLWSSEASAVSYQPTLLLTFAPAM